jgi:anti-anti-sigma factor
MTAGNDLGGDAFSATTERRESGALVTIKGELDLTTLEPVKATLRSAFADADPETQDTVDIDASGVTYIDSLTLALLLAFQVNGPKEGVALRVVAASDEFAHTVTLAGLGDALLPPT